jgi:hypothetical protein
MITIADHLGRDVPVFAAIGPLGVIDLIVREEKGGDWVAAAMAAELLTGTDPETGELIRSRGVNIDVIGPVVVTPAVMAEDGETVVTPDVIDPRTHLNIRLSGPALTNMRTGSSLKKWEWYALAWMRGAEASSNKNEQGQTLSGVTLIDPDSIATPARVWA